MDKNQKIKIKEEGIKSIIIDALTDAFASAQHSYPDMTASEFGKIVNDVNWTLTIGTITTELAKVVRYGLNHE